MLETALGDADSAEDSSDADDDASDSDESLLSSALSAHEAEALAAEGVESALRVSEDYPAMLESASASSSPLSDAAHNVGGLLTKLQSKIGWAIAAKHGDHDAGDVAAASPVPVTETHSFVSSSSSSSSRSHVKGEQWWLTRAPWFLPPPPEWGPLPVTMYTAYFHRPPHAPFQRDYALPAEQELARARRAYPQPPYASQGGGGGGGSFLEQGSSQRAGAAVEVDMVQAELVEPEEFALLALRSTSEAHSPTADDMDDADAEDEQDLDALLLELEQQGASDSASASLAQSHSAGAATHSSHSQFFLDADADKLGPKDSAVEAVEVDDLAAASPVAGENEVYFTQRI